MAVLAEDPPEIAHKKYGLIIRDNFLTRDVNAAGVYCVKMTVDGEPLEVVVDDWFPFYRDKQGVE